MKNKQNRSRSFSLSDVSVLPLHPQIWGLTLLRVHYCRVALSVFPASESNRNRILDMFSGVFSSWVPVDLFFCVHFLLSDHVRYIPHSLPFFFYLHQLNCSIIPCLKASNLSWPKNILLFSQSFIFHLQYSSNCYLRSQFITQIQTVIMTQRKCSWPHNSSKGLSGRDENILWLVMKSNELLLELKWKIICIPNISSSG